VKQIPVYLFTGFLEAGKTKFIQETLEDTRFNSGEKTLLLLCEEGLEEYDPRTFSGANVWITVIESEEDLQPDKLKALLLAHRCERVVVEYNGMWLLNTLYQQMPENWVVAQEFLFADANTFVSYNQNMRQLVYDKLRSCELVVFNRCGEDVDRMALHRIVRAVSRRADIAYEAPDGSVSYDDIVDPPPYDMSAPVVEIGDGDYAFFYADLNENSDSYDGRTVRLKGMAVQTKTPQDKFFVFGRKMLTCCSDDLQFAPVVVEGAFPSGVKSGAWMLVTAKIEFKQHKAYRGKGPVFRLLNAQPAEPPADPVAAFT
jgi:G3E family GTPase